jgi:hypothetical protein
MEANQTSTQRNMQEIAAASARIQLMEQNAEKESLRAQQAEKRAKELSEELALTNSNL